MNMKRIVFYWLILVAVFAFCANTWASDLLLHWDAPTTREDGAALDNADIAQYNVMVKRPQADEFEAMEPIIAVADNTAYELTYQLGQASGEYCFKLQTQDNKGFQSAWTEAVCTQYVAIINPSIPLNITIEIRIKP